jgi:restriction endonuclease S subunit
VFAVKRGDIGKRFDVRYNLPKPKENGTSDSVSLGALCLREPDYGISATAIEKTDESQPKYIRITDFSGNGIEEGHTFTTVSNYLPKHILNNNDILFARSGATVGKTYQYKKSLGLAVFAGYCIRFVINPEKVMPEYVYWYTKTQRYAEWVRKLQRPSGQPNINKEEYKSLKIILPTWEVQKRLVSKMSTALQKRNEKLREVNKLLADIDGAVLEELGIELPSLESRLSYALKLGDVRGTEIYCRPTYCGYLQMIHALKNSRWYKGELKNYVSVNPQTDYSSLQDEKIVSFVPMAAVGNKDNTVIYEERAYSEVKTGYTAFECGDLLWAKITPCMQNGKSCIVSDMPTQIGFGSTEFHVLRKISDKVHIPFVWALLSNTTVLQAAQAVFNGSAGHQRVSDVFLEQFPLPLPDIKKQKEISDIVFAKLDKVYKLKCKAEFEWELAKEQFERKLMMKNDN